MPRPSIYDPRVQYAIARRASKRALKAAAERVLAEIADRSRVRLAELPALTGFAREECAGAVDALRREGKVWLEDDGALAMAQ